MRTDRGPPLKQRSQKRLRFGLASEIFFHLPEIVEEAKQSFQSKS